MAHRANQGGRIVMPPEIISTKPFPAAPAVRERPILFSAPMVRALLGGTKTQTRRAVKLPHMNPLGEWEQMSWGGPHGGRTRDGYTVPLQQAIGHSRTGEILGCPYGQPGDRLWVRETWSHAGFTGARGEISAVPDQLQHPNFCHYSAEWLHSQIRWTPGIHMPRWASRILLEITDVRVERLQDISEADAIAEGIDRSPSMGKPCAFQWCDYRIPQDAAEWFNSPIHSYETLWDQINGAGAWAANSWVWAVSIRRVPPTGGISDSPRGGSTA